MTLTADKSATLSRLFGRSFKGSAASVQRKLTRRAVEQDPIDHMAFGTYAMDSPRFRRVAIDDAPAIAPDVKDPPALDFTSATPDEIREWQKKAREAQALRDAAMPYTPWRDLTEDVYTSYHHHDEPTLSAEPVDPGIDIHRRIMGKLIAQDDHADTRHQTRDDKIMSAGAAMATAKALKELLGDELAEQARETEEFERKRQEAHDRIDQLQQLRDDAAGHHDAGDAIPQELRDAIKQAVADKHSSMQAAADAADGQSPMSAKAMQAIAQAATAGRQAAEKIANLPSFDGGFGQDEPVYESPEQALSIAEMWSTNELLVKIAQMYGRMDPDCRFHRARRVEGGADEITDVQFGDNLPRVLPSELALFGDEDFEDDFLVRYAGAELLEFATVGEATAGRGPIVCVIDGSHSMKGERTVWARAMAMVLLHIARREKRDYAVIEFADAGQCEQWLFEAKRPLNAEHIIEMASHFYGGGTVPIQGIQKAADLMARVSAFTKADICLIGDGEASFGPEDQRLRDQLVGKGVRLWGMAVGSARMKYLDSYCETVFKVRDFELSDPSAATAALATHIS